MSQIPNPESEGTDHRGDEQRLQPCQSVAAVPYEHPLVHRYWLKALLDSLDARYLHGGYMHGTRSHSIR